MLQEVASWHMGTVSSNVVKAGRNRYGGLACQNEQYWLYSVGSGQL